MHPCAESAYGSYWSLSRYKDVVEWEMDTQTFSSVSKSVQTEDKLPDKRFLIDASPDFWVIPTTGVGWQHLDMTQFDLHLQKQLRKPVLGIGPMASTHLSLGEEESKSAWYSPSSGYLIKRSPQREAMCRRPRHAP